MTDSVTAEDLGKFPDVNIAESLRRVPGVTLQRNDVGEGQTISLRGLAGFTLTEINEMTAANDPCCSFNFHILPADFFSSVTIYKTINASLTEGGLAGLVTLDTPEPFDYGDKISFSSQTDYRTPNKAYTPRAAVTVSNIINDKMSYLLSIGYFEGDWISNQIRLNSLLPFSQVARDAGVGGPKLQKALVSSKPIYRIYGVNDEVTSFASVLQFRPTDNLDIAFKGIYATQGEIIRFDVFEVPIEFNVSDIYDVTLETFPNGVDVITAATLRFQSNVCLATSFLEMLSFHNSLPKQTGKV